MDPGSVCMASTAVWESGASLREQGHLACRGDNNKRDSCCQTAQNNLSIVAHATSASSSGVHVKLQERPVLTTAWRSAVARTGQSLHIGDEADNQDGRQNYTRSGAAKSMAHRSSLEAVCEVHQRLPCLEACLVVQGVFPQEHVKDCACELSAAPGAGMVCYPIPEIARGDHCTSHSTFLCMITFLLLWLCMTLHGTTWCALTQASRCAPQSQEPGNGTDRSPPPNRAMLI